MNWVYLVTYIQPHQRGKSMLVNISSTCYTSRSSRETSLPFVWSILLGPRSGRSSNDLATTSSKGSCSYTRNSQRRYLFIKQSTGKSSRSGERSTRYSHRQGLERRPYRAIQTLKFKNNREHSFNNIWADYSRPIPFRAVGCSAVVEVKVELRPIIGPRV